MCVLESTFKAQNLLLALLTLLRQPHPLTVVFAIKLPLPHPAATPILLLLTHPKQCYQ